MVRLLRRRQGCHPTCHPMRRFPIGGGYLWLLGFTFLLLWSKNGPRCEVAAFSAHSSILFSSRISSSRNRASDTNAAFTSSSRRKDPSFQQRRIVITRLQLDMDDTEEADEDVPELVVHVPEDDDNNNVQTTRRLTHADVIWKLQSPPEIPTPMAQHFLKTFGRERDEYCKTHNQTDPPMQHFPDFPGYQVFMTVHLRNQNDSNKNDDHDNSEGTLGPALGRFGFTQTPGPTPDVLQHAAEKYFFTMDDDKNDRNENVVAAAAAIKYIFVEPAYRKRGLGELAMQIMTWMQGQRGCNLILAIVDDDGSGKLVDWYVDTLGYTQVPELQALMGSPNQEYGVAVMGRPVQTLQDEAQVKLVWW